MREGGLSADVVKCLSLLPPPPLVGALLATLTQMNCCPRKVKPLPLYLWTARRLDDDTVDSLIYGADEMQVLLCK